MKKVIATIVLLAANLAMADGFVCTSQSGMNLKVYNHVNPEEGTRTAAIMILSDSNIQHGHKTIARFTEVEGNLTSAGTNYVAKVDLRFKNLTRKGELLAGTKLGYVDRIHLSISHNYLMPKVAGTYVGGQLQILKRDGSQVYEAVNCVRYLKN